MPQIKSQMKRMRTSEKQRIRNKGVKSALKTHVANVDKALQEENKELTKDALAKAIKTLDRAASKGVIHKNKAANKKSKLTRKFNAMPETPAKVEVAIEEEKVEKKPTKRGGTKKKTTAKKAAAAKKTAKAKATDEKPKTTKKTATAKKATKKEK